MISLSVAKLSTAEDALPHQQTFQWKHETNNLTCVFDSYRTGGPALQLMKVVQGTQVREQIELERLINEAEDLVRSMQKRGIEMKGDQLPISAIVRRPLLAIRWQLPNQKVRRLQIRFQSNEDYDRVYTHLHHLGLRMTTPQHQSKDRGSTASSEQSRASGLPSASPTRPSMQPEQLSCPPSRLSEISARPYTALPTPTASEPPTQEATHARPTSAFTGSSFAPHNPLTPPMYFPRPASASVLSPDYSPFPPRDGRVANEHHEGFPSRPDTALLYDRPDTADLPPRRELPFRRDSTSSGTQSRPSTAVMGPPPLPMRVSDLRPSSARTASLDGELPPLRQPTILDETPKTISTQQRPHTPRPASRGRAKPAQTIVLHEDRLDYSPTSSSPQAYPTPTAASPDATRPLSPVSNGGQNQRQSASPGAYTSPSTPGSKNVADHTFASPLPSDFENALKAYATQSDDGRKAALNDFILKALDSNDFLTLVDDMETNWARLGLGTW